MNIDDLPTPALLVDRQRVAKNCASMIQTAQKAGLAKAGHIKLRAQTKTHKTIEGAVMQTGGSKRSLVCSTQTECEAYASSGFDDILYGQVLLESHMPRNYDLCQKLDQFHVMVGNMEGVNILANWMPPSGKSWSVFVKIDCGYPRSGISHQRYEYIKEVLLALDQNTGVTFKGLYAHCGNSYSGRSVDEVEKLRDGAIADLAKLAERLTADTGIQMPDFGTGSTPSCSHYGQEMSKLTEIHPGNYIFYDLQQHMLGSCEMDDIACCVLVRVLTHAPERNEFLIDCGFMGLSQQGFNELGGTYAMIEGHPGLTVYKMTQEIGYVKARDSQSGEEPRVLDLVNDFPVGSVLKLYQYHNCDTANKYKKFYVHEDGKVVEEWSPVSGW